MNKVSNINFKSNVVLKKGVADRFISNPEDMKVIEEFRNYVKNDGKNWNIELSYDEYKPSKKQVEDQIKDGIVNRDFIKEYSARNYLKKLTPQESAEIVKSGLTISDKMNNTNAVLDIAKIQDTKIASDLLLSVLHGENKDLVAYAASNLGIIKDSEILTKTFNEIKNSNNEEAKENAGESICRIKDLKLQKELLENCLNGNDASLKVGVARTFTCFKNADYRQIAEELMASDCPNVRKSTILSLLDLSNEDYIKNADYYDSIIERGVKDKFPQVRKYSAMSLGRLSDSKKAANLIYDVASKDSDDEVKRNAIASIAYIKDVKIANGIFDYAVSTLKPEIFGRNFITENVNPDFIRHSIETLSKQDNPELRIAAVKKISYLQDPKEILLYVNKFMSDSDQDVRAGAMHELCYIKDSDVKHKFIDANLNTSDTVVKRELVSLISNMASTEPLFAQKCIKKFENEKDEDIQNRVKSVKSTLDNLGDKYKIKIKDENNNVLNTEIAGTDFLYQKINLSSTLYDAYSAIVKA